MKTQAGTKTGNEAGEASAAFSPKRQFSLDVLLLTSAIRNDRWRELNAMAQLWAAEMLSGCGVVITALMCPLAVALPSVARRQADAKQESGRATPVQPSEPQNEALAVVNKESASPPAESSEPEKQAPEEAGSGSPLKTKLIVEKEQGQVPMNELNVGQPVATAKKRPFFQDAKMRVQLRNSYFDRERYDENHATAWAQGGSLSFKSGYFMDRFAIGLVGYASLPLVAEDNHQGNGLLATNPTDYRLHLTCNEEMGVGHYFEQTMEQTYYAVLGQVYGEIRILDSLQLSFGRKEYNTPYVNMHDVRMTPKTFEGITIAGTHEGLSEDSQGRYGFGYLNAMKNWTDSTFNSMSDSLGVEEDRGVFLAGLNYSTKCFSIGAIDYYSNDVINIFYAEGSYTWPLSPRASLKLSGQFSDQLSTGDDLITGASFEVQQYGVKTDFQYGPAMVTLAYTDVSDVNQDMRSPWGGYPGFTSVQTTDLNRADEAASMVKGSYDFSSLGADGLSLYALWVNGSDRNGLSDDVKAYNEDEWNVYLHWAPKKGCFEG